MPTLYLDLHSGISGDMFLGALLDLGVPFDRLEAELSKLGIHGYHLHATRAAKSGIAGTKFDVHLESDHGHGPNHPYSDHHHDHGHDHDHAHHHDHGHHHHHHHDHHHHSHEDGHGIGHDHVHDRDHTHPHSHSHSHWHSHEAHDHNHHGHHDHEHAGDPLHAEHGRNYADIRDLIARSSLSDWVKDRASAVFRRIAVAEGKIHGHPPEEVHFHEVGALDSIVDIVGACVALDLLGRPEVLAGPVIEGTGSVHCAHGCLPLPAPATLEILAVRHVPVSQCDEPHELVTPTGAALLAEFSSGFQPFGGFAAHRVGYGLGTRDNRTRPNVLRVVLGERQNSSPTAGNSADWERDTVAVLETNLDDLSPEILGHFAERALAAGALDVFHTAVQMKKGRPGVLLTILCATEAADQFAEMLLTETSAFGVRQSTTDRRKLRREFRKVATPYGEITIKLGMLRGRVVQAAPEFETCRMAAEAAQVPVRTVFEAASAAAQALRGTEV